MPAKEWLGKFFSSLNSSLLRVFCGIISSEEEAKNHFFTSTERPNYILYNLSMDDKKINQDNILILDESGDFKILQGEELLPYQKITEPAAKAAIVETGFKPAPTIATSTSVTSNLPVDTGREEKMLPPLPPTVRKSTASFYFHPSDEEEVGALARNLNSSIGKKYSLDKIVKKVIDNYHLTLNEELKKKFEQIIFTFLRDRRTAIETGVLLKAKEFAAAGLSENIADSLLDFLKEIKNKIQEAKGLVVNEAVSGQAPDLIMEEAAKITEASPKAIPKISAASAQLTPAILINETERLKEATRQAQAQIKPESAKTIPHIISKSGGLFGSSLKFSRPERTSANQMTDVKKGYKLFGPVEELASLTLENFRRFANTPAERAGKILTRINVLAKDSLIKKSAGITAWKQSPIYKMYLAIGQASMEHDLDVKQVIAEYQKEGKDIISMEEFEAITDLNRQLRF